jgi:acetyl-CoA carboxylase carboxyl transferase subunit alpha
MGITAKRLKEHNIIDEVVKEPLGGAHRNINEAAKEIKLALQRLLADLINLPNEERLARRYEKLMSFGAFEG